MLAPARERPASQNPINANSSPFRRDCRKRFFEQSRCTRRREEPEMVPAVLHRSELRRWIAALKNRARRDPGAVPRGAEEEEEVAAAGLGGTGAGRPRERSRSAALPRALHFFFFFSSSPILLLHSSTPPVVVVERKTERKNVSPHRDLPRRPGRRSLLRRCTRRRAELPQAVQVRKREGSKIKREKSKRRID